MDNYYYDTMIIIVYLLFRTVKLGGNGDGCGDTNFPNNGNNNKPIVYFDAIADHYVWTVIKDVSDPNSPLIIINYNGAPVLKKRYNEDSCRDKWHRNINSISFESKDGFKSVQEYRNRPTR